MDTHERRAKFHIALAHLEESATDVLLAMQDEGREELEVVQVLARVGRKADYTSARHGIVRGALSSFEENGIAFNARVGARGSSWRVSRQDDPQAGDGR